MIFVDNTASSDSDIALEEQLDLTDPLRHFKDDSELEGIISSDALARASQSESELLTVLPRQSHSVKDGVLKLSFAHEWNAEDVPRPLEISLIVDASPGCGGLAWPAGQILASYLIQKGSKYAANKLFLELGSGTGLVGLAVGKMANTARGIWITDQAPLVAIMNRNVQLNNVEGKVHVAELNWGGPIPKEIPLPDVVLAADCVYFEPAFPLLVQTLSDLATSKTDIYFCYKKRRKADKRFFNMLKKVFSWKEVMDDPNRQIYTREAITLIQLFKL